MMSYTRTASSTMLHAGPPHLTYAGGIQSNGGGLHNGNAASAPPTLSMASGHSSSQHQQECTYCQRRIEGLSIKCCECVDFYLCLKCFSMSAEIGEHKKDHNYFIISKLNFPLFDSEKLWTYKEELLLLQFIEQYGFGNWEEIAKHLPSRTAEECLQHYNSYYIYGNLGKYTFNANSRNILMSNGSHAGVKSNLYNETPWYSPSKASTSNSIDAKKQNLVSASSLSLSAADTVLLPPVEMSSEEQRALGYMPLRDDYERDYKNDAESMLSNLAIAHNQVFLLNHNTDALTTALTNGNGTTTNGHPLCNGETKHHSVSYPIALSSLGNGLIHSPSVNTNGSSSSATADLDDIIDYELKLSLIKMYCDCLSERERFKHVAREYGLVNNASALINSHAIALVNGAYGLTDPKYITSLNNGTLSNGGPGRKKKNPSKVVKEVDEDNEKFKKFAHLMSASEFECLLSNIKKHRCLTKRLHELQQAKPGTAKGKDTPKVKREEESPLSTPQLVRPERKKKFSFKPSSASKPTPSKRFKREESPTTYKLNDSYFQKMKAESKSSIKSEPNSHSPASNRRKSTSSRNSSRSSSVGSQVSEENSIDSSSKSSSATQVTTTSEATSKSTESSNSRLYKIANKQKFVDYEEEEEGANGVASSDDEAERDSDSESAVPNGDNDALSTTTTNSAATDDDASSLGSSTNGIARRLRGSTSTSKSLSDNHKSGSKRENGSSKSRRVSTRSARKSSESKLNSSKSSRLSKSQVRRKLKRLVYDEDEETNGDEADSTCNMDVESDETAQNSSDEESTSGSENEEETSDNDTSSATTNDQESNGGRKLTRSNSKLNHSASRDRSKSGSSPSKSRRAGRLCSMPGYYLLSENEKKVNKRLEGRLVGSSS